MNEPQTLGALVTLILGAGSAFGWWLRRRDQKKDPLPKAAAELAVAQQALGIITDAATWAKNDNTDLRSRVAQLEKDRAEDRVRITRLETLLSHAAAYIEALLRWAQIMPTDPERPVPPLPDELHELVDPQLWITHHPNQGV